MKYFLFCLLLLFTFYSAEAQSKSLDYYISAALQKSPLLNDYNNQKLTNLIDSLRILAGYKPQVNGVSNNTYAPSFNGFGYDYAITNGANVSELITVNKKLVGKENLNNQHEAIRLLNRSLDITGKISEQDLKKSITAQYITAYGNWQQYSFNKEMLDLLQKEETILKLLTEKGVYRQTDYLNFLVTVRQQELTISQIKLQFQNEFATLNYLAGIKDTSAEALATPQIELVLLPEAEGTIFYQKYKIDSLKLKNDDALIEYNYKPKVNLFADGGYVSSFAEQPYKNFGISGGVNITVPIYDGKQKKMQHDKNAIAEKTRQGYRDFFKTQYEQQIAQLAQQLSSTQLLINQASEQIKYAQTLIEANRKLLQTGDARMTDYILAIGNYLAAKNIVTQNTTNKLQIINQINYWNRK